MSNVEKSDKDEESSSCCSCCCGILCIPAAVAGIFLYTLCGSTGYICGSMEDNDEANKTVPLKCAKLGYVCMYMSCNLCGGVPCDCFEVGFKDKKKLFSCEQKDIPKYIYNDVCCTAGELQHVVEKIEEANDAIATMNQCEEDAGGGWFE